jgi:hypothetical protein
VLVFGHLVHVQLIIKRPSIPSSRYFFSIRVIRDTDHSSSLLALWLLSTLASWVVGLGMVVREVWPQMMVVMVVDGGRDVITMFVFKSKSDKNSNNGGEEGGDCLGLVDGIAPCSTMPLGCSLALHSTMPLGRSSKRLFFFIVVRARALNLTSLLTGMRGAWVGLVTGADSGFFGADFFKRCFLFLLFLFLSTLCDNPFIDLLPLFFSTQRSDFSICQ